MKKYYLKKLSEKKIKALLQRPGIDLEKVFKKVKPVIKKIRENGMPSALSYAKRFDGFKGKDLRVQEKEFAEAERIVPAEVKNAIEISAENIRKFHLKQIPAGYRVETQPGVVCSREFRAIENVGLYIPGGTAVLPSTMLMLGIPAVIAGCGRIVVCSPVRGGSVNPVLLYAAKLCGIKEFYKIGGAQAVALLAYGCDNIRKVDKIFGPGSQYVTAAKMLVSIDMDGAAVDMPAGPSEVLVIADENAEPSFVAADLLSQAEHGTDSQVILITTSGSLADAAVREIKKQIKALPRKQIAAKSLADSLILVADTLDDAFYFSNRYAPEHLIIHLEDAEKYRSKVTNAGSVFLGRYSPESAGDYSSGTNHSLPTSGFAKVMGGVSIESFMKSITFQQLTLEGLKNISSAVETLAETEGLHAHRNAVAVRLSGIKK